MRHYLYDGSFAGLLTVLDVALCSATVPAGISHSSGEQQAGLFALPERIETDPDRAARLLAEVERRMSPVTSYHLRHAFLSEAPLVELLLFRYLELGRQAGRNLDSLLAHERVVPVHRLSRRVAHEAHRLKGFVRFREVREGFYYAPVAPDHRVLTLIAPHFAERFRDQHWVIHDERRATAVVHPAGSGEWRETPLEVTGTPAPAAREAWFASLWKSYFERLAVAERHNPRLQQGKVPHRYRRHLTEFAPPFSGVEEGD